MVGFEGYAETTAVPDLTAREHVDALVGGWAEDLSGVASWLIQTDHVDTVKDGAVGWLCVTHLGGSAVTLVGKEGEAETTAIIYVTAWKDVDTLVGQRAE